MTGLTLQQIQQMGGTPVTPVQPTGKGLTLAQISQMGGTPITIPQTQDQTDLPGRVATDLQNRGNEVNNILNENTQNSNPVGGVADVMNTLSKATRITGTAFGGVLDTAKETINSIPGAKTVEEVGGNLYDKFASLFANNPQNEAQANQVINDLANSHPEAFKAIINGLGTLQGTGEIANNIIPFDAVPKTGISNVSEIPGAIKDTLKEMKPGGFKSSPSADLQSKLQGVADDWRKPTTINEPKYNNARAVLEKDPQVPETLTQKGLNPFSHVEDGKYVTKDSAIQLRSDTGKLSRDILRPSLQAADYSVERTPVMELNPQINDFGNTAIGSEKISSHVTSELEALQRKYPDGMSLTDLLDEKINYDKNGGYNQFKSNADTREAIANRAIARNIESKLIANAPKDLPIADFFAEQAKNYRAADYLKSLNGIKAPVNIAQSIARNVAKFGGAKLGAMFGGDVVSSFAGYQIGKVLETFVENMTNPMRDSFLQNLKITNPEAFTKMQDFLGATEINRATTLKLPEGSPSGTANNPIITPAPSEQAQMDGRARTILKK